MKILTLNTWQEMGRWQERWEVTLEGIERFRPDLVAFQELFNRAWAQEIQKRTGFPTFLFPQEPCGLVLYTHNAVTSWGVVTLPPSPLEEYLRYLLWAELRVRGQSLFVFNTHLSWKLEDGTTRKKQVGELLAVIQEKALTGESLLMGDLNAPPHSPEIRWLIETGRFRDLFSEKHPEEAGFTWSNLNPYAANATHKLPDRRIDFILARGSGPLLKHLVSCDLVLNRPDAKGVWASDHLGVLAQFQ